MRIQSACTQLAFIYSIIIGFAGTAITTHATSVSLTGDSTVATGSGWGDSLIKFLPAGVTVDNNDLGGTSTKSFIDGGYWQSTVDSDSNYVFIQFGHNDQKLNDTARGT